MAGIAVYGLPLAILESQELFESENTVILAIVSIYGVGFGLAFNAFISVATWRSAGRYQGAVSWAVLARLVVVVLIAVFIFGLPEYF